LQILYDYCHGLLKAQTYLQVDETTIKVQDPKLKGSTHLGYYWAYYAPITQLSLFEYKPGRGGKHVWETLSAFRGYMQTDGYAGYNQIAARPDIVHLSCMAHIRRKFFDAQNNDKARAQKALLYIQKLYAIESKATELQLTAEQRKELRLTEALPIINEMGKWIAAENKLVLPKSAIGKAFYYAIERWEEMSNYLLDGNLLIDNNLIENQIRPIALGRKNYLFAGSHEAAQRAAVIYTFMAQCKLAKVNPNEWLAYVLTNLQTTKINQLEKLLPINFGK
ncbi:MAG: IS66 family transposase, partial [Bacteroidia bacterium]